MTGAQRTKKDTWGMLLKGLRASYRVSSALLRSLHFILEATEGH